jgi:hypothetical protein
MGVTGGTLRVIKVGASRVVFLEVCLRSAGLFARTGSIKRISML